MIRLTLPDSLALATCLLLLISSLSLSIAAEVRLLQNSVSTISSGTVQIRQNSVSPWGTICDDDWDKPDADVICRMLGFPYADEAVSEARFGQGEGEIYLDDMNCTGSEEDILDCGNRGWADDNCAHSEDAGVICHKYNVICPNDSITAAVNRTTWRADIMFTSGGLKQSINLPMGHHSLSLTNMITVCDISLTVYDPAITRRVVFRAVYNISCTHIGSYLARNLLRAQLIRGNLHIDEICKEECQSVGEPVFSCEDDTLTVDWLTNISFNALTTDLASEFSPEMLERLRQKNDCILHLAFFTASPPIVSPMENEHGLPLTLMLKTTCEEEAMTYDAQQDKCLE